MWSNCAQTCGRCKCISWKEPDVGEPSPTASCYSCCSQDSQCPTISPVQPTWGAEKCSLSPPRPWKDHPTQSNVKETNYDYDIVGGENWEITGHPYWRVSHRKIVNQIPTVTGTQSNDAPVPRRGGTMLMANGVLWMFGGLGVVPVERPQDYPNSEVQAFKTEGDV